MAIDFNSPNTSARLNTPKTQGSINPPHINTQDASKNSNLAVKNTAVSSGESVQLSQDARQLHTISETLASTPSVNSEKVAQLKQAIADGSYQIDSQRVASKLLSLEAQL